MLQIRETQDSVIISCVLVLVLIGIAMVASTSMAISADTYGHPYHYIVRHLFHVSFAVLCYFVAARFSIEAWQRLSLAIFLISVVLAFIVLIPGIGAKINGSRRWLHLGVTYIQVSEVMKVALIVYGSDYLQRNREQLQTWSGLVKPLFGLILLSILLLLQPDYGAMIVLLVLFATLIFVAGTPLSRFILFGFVALITIIVLALMVPYRLQRITAFF